MLRGGTAVGEFQLQSVRAGERAVQRMHLIEQQVATRREGRRDRAHPGRHIADPTEDTNSRVYQVETTVQRSGERRRLGLDPVDADPDRAAMSAALASDAAEKSVPVTWAPRRASDTVSKPIWHCTCRMLSPARSSSRPRAASNPARSPLPKLSAPATRPTVS